MFCCSFTACINYVFQNHISSFLLPMNPVYFLSGFCNDLWCMKDCQKDVQNLPVPTFFFKDLIILLNINQPVPILFHTHDQTFKWHVFVCFMGNLQWSWVLSPWINNTNLVSVYTPFSLVYFLKHQVISQIYLRP